MRLCWFDDYRLGLVRDDKVADVTPVLEALPAEPFHGSFGDPVVTHFDALRRPVAEHAAGARWRPLEEVRLLSPVQRPSKIIGTPANYLKHVEEADADEAIGSDRYSGAVRDQGMFLKANSALVGSSQGVTLRFPERRTDHEMELGVVIGARCSQVSEQDAMRHVFGYAIALDMVVRGKEDRSFRKSVDSYAVLGPWVVTADEVADPNDLDFSLSVNGEVRQRSNTRLMILSVAQQIAWASQFYTLWPGDVIMTGTCEGVGQVHPGDTMHCQIAGIASMDVTVR